VSKYYGDGSGASGHDRHMTHDNRPAILQGTLDLMVLKTLDAMGPMHGYGLARRIEQISAKRVTPCCTD
jgi:hypothetical protein